MEAGSPDAAAQSPQVDDGTQPECILCSSRVAEINRLLEENRRLKEELSGRDMNENSLKDDDKVRLYTGLPSLALFMALPTEIMPSLPQSTKGRKISNFQVLLLTLMRIRLNLPLHLLGHLFNIGRHTVRPSCKINSILPHNQPVQYCKCPF